MIKCYSTEMYSSFSSNFCQIATLVTFLDFCKKNASYFPHLERRLPYGQRLWKLFSFVIMVWHLRHAQLNHNRKQCTHFIIAHYIRQDTSIVFLQWRSKYRDHYRLKICFELTISWLINYNIIENLSNKPFV